MKSFFVNAIAKKTVALLLVLAIAVGVAFAAPLAPKAGFGDAKVYDSSYKAVKNPTEVSDGFVLRTATSTVVLSGANAEVEVEANSLLQFINIGDQPVFYLLDGRAIFTSNSAFEVRTPVTIYQGEAGTSIYVITEEEEETAYVNSGLATATNLITKEVTKIGDGQYIDNARRGFTPTSTTKEEYWAKSTAASEQAVPAKEETPASATEEAVAQPAETKPAETAPVVSETVVTEAGALEHTFEYRGFRAVLRAYIGVAELDYPAFVTNEELDAAARAAVYTYPDLTSEIAYEIVEPGSAKIYYPETYGKTEFDYAVQILEKELAGYIDAVLGLEPEQVVQEPVAETAETAETVGPLVKEFSHRGIEARIEAYIGECDIYYPQFVTNEEIDAAAAAAVWKYPEYTQGITYAVVEPGHAKAYYPVEYGPAEFYFAMGLLESELYAYIDELFARYAATAEPVEEPATEQAPEAPVEPEVEKTPIETTPKAEEPVVEPEPVVEDKGFKFGATVAFIYGHGDKGDFYNGISFLHDRVGLFQKNYMVIVDPTFSVGNFKFGLHLVADFRSGKLVNPLNKFTGRGVTGIVNGVMQFVSLFNYTNGNFVINVDRTSDIEFRSPIFAGLNREFEYDPSSRLQATMAFKGGEFGFNAFVDDLSFQAKLEGRSQFAGARMAFFLGKMEIGLSVVADLKNGFRDIAFYPGGDAYIPFTIKDIDFALEGGAVASFRKTGKAAMIEGKFKKTSGLITFGVGGAYSVRYNFNDLINVGPTDVISTWRGKSIDILANVGLNTKFFTLSAEVRAPFAIKGSSRLVYNTVLDKYGNTQTISADTMTFKADVMLGKFTFTAGAAFNGFAGRVADLLKAIKNASGRRAALAGIVDPGISTFYAQASFSLDIGPGSLGAYVRADVAGIEKITIPVSAGIKYSF